MFHFKLIKTAMTISCQWLLRVSNMDFEQFFFQSWDQAYFQAYYLYEQISKDSFTPNIIVGIARGGWILARLLCDFFTLNELANIKIEFYTQIGERRSNPILTQEVNADLSGKKVLLVDDVADTGKSLQIALKHLQEKNPQEIKTVTYHYKPHSLIKPDYYCHETTKWIVYPWEYIEFIKEIHEKYKNEKTINEIKTWLKSLPIPPYLVNDYFSRISSL